MVLFCQVYHLIDRVRCLPDIVPSIALPEESRKLFCAYIGAIYVDSGLDKIYSWIRQLFSEGVYSPMTVSNRLLAEDELCLPAKKRMRLNTTSNTTTSGISIPSLATHPSTSSLTSPKTQRFLNISFDSNNQSKASLPSESRASANAGLTSSLSDPLFPPMQPLEQVDNPPPWVRHRDAVKSGQCLPVFNQLASQKCLSVEWHPAFEVSSSNWSEQEMKETLQGSPHNGAWNRPWGLSEELKFIFTGTWIMQCVVQGIPRGYGKGPNKSAAKEDAVRQAWIVSCKNDCMWGYWLWR